MNLQEEKCTMVSLETGVNDNSCLSDVVARINTTRPPVAQELDEAVTVVVSYFKRPMHEISISDIRWHRRFIPLYLSFLRVALEDLPAMMQKVDLLLDFALMTQPQIPNSGNAN
jgi:hypothetical protein